MTIRLLTIPDDPAQWSTWLEQQLVNVYLNELVEELQLNPRPGQSSELPLSQIVDDDQLSEVVHKGLTVLRLEQIQELLANPASLLELQENVVQADERYWNSLPATGQAQDAVDRVRGRLTDIPKQDPNRIVKEAPAIGSQKDIGKARSLRALAWIVTAAAVLVFGVFFWPDPSGLSGRILGTPGLVANDVSSSAEYFERLADAGNQWFDETPRNRNDLVVLLREVSSDCEILINAPHEALTNDERAWFVEKCENWKQKIDQTLAALEAGDMDFDSAQRESDKIMLKLVNVLKAGPNA